MVLIYMEWTVKNLQFKEQKGLPQGLSVAFAETCSMKFASLLKRRKPQNKHLLPHRVGKD